MKKHHNSKTGNVSSPSIFDILSREQPPLSTNPLIRWSDWAMRLGIGGYDRETQRRLALVNIAGYLSALSCLSFVINFMLTDMATFKWLIAGNLLSAVVTLTAPFWHRYNSIAAASVMTSIVAITLFFFVYELGRDSGIQLNYIGSVAIAFLIFGLKHIRIVILVAAICIIGHLASYFLFKTGSVQALVDPAFIQQIYILSSTSIIIILFLVVWYAFQMAHDAEKRTELLLNNMLPIKIADQLRQYPHDPIADRFDEASVLFADIVGFTELSLQLKPGEMVYILNELFSGFDEQCELLDVEKIKTIGDAYMAVSGVPNIRDDHAERIMKLALGMIKVTKTISANYNHDLNIRIGIATGPITAGVIGKAKFAYDVWSPTVNLASRLESMGEVGKIHVSQETYRSLKDKYPFKKANDSRAKGIGLVRSWFLDQ